jgi:hypothetical protein
MKYLGPVTCLREINSSGSFRNTEGKRMLERTRHGW